MLIVLCCVTRMVLIPHLCFSYSWAVLITQQHQGYLSCQSSPLLQRPEGGAEQELGRRPSQGCWPKQTKRLFCVIWCCFLKQKLSEKSRREVFVTKVFIFKATGRECMFLFLVFFFLLSCRGGGSLSGFVDTWCLVDDNPRSAHHSPGWWLGEALENLRGGQ